MALGSKRRNRRTSLSVPVDRRDFQEGVRPPELAASFIFPRPFSRPSRHHDQPPRGRSVTHLSNGLPCYWRLLADGRQFKHLVLDDRIVGLLGKLPIHGRLVA